MGQTIADRDLQLSAQALAVLAMLAQREPAFATYDKKWSRYNYECATSAWYNGRERGICLVVRRLLSDEKCLVITFGEVRNSDHIFVDSWKHEGHFLNPPTIDDFPNEAYAERQYIDYGRVDLAVNMIIAKITEFFASLPPVEEPKPEAPKPPAPVRTLEIEGDDG